ncbi:MAG: class I SAM-dependent methyltransferase [Methermicoccaceae archaeon]
MKPRKDGVRSLQRQDEMRKNIEIVKRTLIKIGVGENKQILEFGCGSGTYTIPLAEIAGSKGKIYALDKDEIVLKKLKKKIEDRGLKNVKILHTKGGGSIPLNDESVEIVILYDVFHDFYFPQGSDRRKLLDEIHRVLRPEGFLSVWPKHMERDAEGEIEDANFVLMEKHVGELIHDDFHFERGQILNFKKLS